MSGFAPLGGAPLGALVPTAVEEAESTNTLTTTDAATALESLLATIADAFAAANTITPEEYAYGLRESLVLTTSLTGLAEFRVTLLETLNLDDKIVSVLQGVLADTVGTSNSVTATPLRTAAIVDSLLLTGTATTTIEAIAILAEALTFDDAIARVQAGDIADSAAFADALSVRHAANQTLVVNLALADSVIGLVTVTAVLAETVPLADTPTAKQRITEVLSDAIAFSVGFQFEGLSYVGLALQGASHGVTEYTNYDYNALAEFNGHLYGTNDDGLYQLDVGDDDAGTEIDAYLRTGLYRVGDGKKTRMDSAYLGYRSDGTLQLKVIVTTGGQKKAYVYDLAEVEATSNRAGRAKIGRGLETQYAAFELLNVDGADFAADVLSVHPLVLDRRIP